MDKSYDIPEEIMADFRKEDIRARRQFSSACRAQLNDIQRYSERVMAGEPEAWEKLRETVKLFEKTATGYIALLRDLFLRFRDNRQYCEEVGKCIGRVMRTQTLIRAQWAKARLAHGDFDQQGE